MRHFRVLGLIAIAFSISCGAAAHAEPRGAGTAHIEWEVKNRFRLFRNEADFQRHVAATRNDSVLAAEQRLARETDGRGWARDMVERLCVDRAGKLLEICDRDGEREVYLSPRDHRVGVALAGTVPANEGCVWSFDDGEAPARAGQRHLQRGGESPRALRPPSTVSVDIVLLDGTAQRLVSEIQVRDVLIAGMGDSIAAGEGNPDRAVRLSDEGFCFKRFDGRRILPARPRRLQRQQILQHHRRRDAGVERLGAAERALDERPPATARSTATRCAPRSRSRSRTRISPSHSFRSAARAPPSRPDFSSSQRARECPNPGTGASCPGTARAQIAELTDLMATARRHRSDRSLDLVLLTIGANDILFSGLIANVIVEPGTERSLLNRGGILASVEEAQKVLDRDLPGNFAKLRSALKPLVGGNLSRVVYVTYGNPALAGPDTPCPGGRDGFDVHPAFGADGERLRQAADFVSRKFLPGIKALARCEDGKTCRDPATERMTFVDAHQAAFAAARCVRARRRRSGIRSRMLFRQGRDLRAQPDQGRDRPDDLRLSGQRIPPLRAARALDPHRQRQLFHRHDLSRGAARAAAAERPARRHLGRIRRGLWRRRASDRRGPCRHGGRRAAGGARRCSASPRRPNPCAASRCRRRKFRSRRECRRPAGSCLAGRRPCASPRERGTRHATPSFFCRLVDDVVYWNTRRLSG